MLTDGGAIKMDNVLLKPHCAQVLTVLHMLGYGADGSGGGRGQLEHQVLFCVRVAGYGALGLGSQSWPPSH